jgi:hypothetical protein
MSVPMQQPARAVVPSRKRLSGQAVRRGYAALAIPRST